MAEGDQTVEVDGVRVLLRNLDKVLFPDSGTTKGELLHYLVAVAPVLLPHLAGRPVTRMRWPHGVEGASFVEKNLPAGTPAWVERVEVPVPASTKNRSTVLYPLVQNTAALVWLANLAAIELHVPQWRIDLPSPVDAAGFVQPLPDRLVIDLDPGAPAGLAECAEVALAVRERLRADGLEPVPVTSGSKGLQLYAPLARTQSAEVVRGYAERVAREMAAQHPLVVFKMTRSLRGGKVLLDWSQNSASKTTISPYSPRARALPQMATPRTWAELEAGSALTQVRLEEVADRVASLGDLAAPLLSAGAKIPD